MYCFVTIIAALIICAATETTSNQHIENQNHHTVGRGRGKTNQHIDTQNHNNVGHGGGKITSNQHIGTQNHNTVSIGGGKRAHNLTYMDREENMVRMPTLNHKNEENKSKKQVKKSPKRIIQKIIKKKQAKLRKVYFRQIPTHTTSKPKVNYDKVYDENDGKKWETTTHPVHKRRVKNINVNRRNIPFQKLQKRKEAKRHKRGLSKELIALKDLNKAEFISKEKDDDIFDATVTDSSVDQ